MLRSANLFLFSCCLLIGVTSFSQDGSDLKKQAINHCAEKKLKFEKSKNPYLSKTEQDKILEKFKIECSKSSIEMSYAYSELQAIAAAKTAEKEEQQQKESKKQIEKAQQPVTTNVSKPSSGAVIGGCGTPEQCAAYMAESAKPKYSWAIPVPFMNAPMDAYSTRGGGFDIYERPNIPCNSSNQGQLIAVDFGVEVRAVACMGPDVKVEDMIEKLKNAKVDSLPKIEVAKKPKYEWKTTREPAPLEEDEVRICTPPGLCTGDNIGQDVDTGKCGAFKCIRADGGNGKKPTDAKIDKDKPAENSSGGK